MSNDEGHVPPAKPGPDARGICTRCKAVAEHQTVGRVCHVKGGPVEEVTLCLECDQLAFTDDAKFFNEGW